MGWSCASVSEPLEWAPVPAGGDKDTRARVRVEGSRGGGDSKSRWGQQGQVGTAKGESKGQQEVQTP